MSSRISSLIRSNLVGCIALFCVLTGTALAVTKAPKNSVVTRSIKHGAVTSKKLHKQSVKTSKLAPSAVVPNAVHAITADQLGGLDASAYQRRVTGTCDRGSGEFINSAGEIGCAEGPIESIVMTPQAGDSDFRSLADFHLFLDVLCHKSGKTEIAFSNNSGGGATLNWLYSDGTTVSASGNSLGASDTQEFSFAGGRLEGQFIFAYGGNVTTFVVHAFDGTSFCEVRGNSYVGSG